MTLSPYSECIISNLISFHFIFTLFSSQFSFAGFILFPAFDAVYSLGSNFRNIQFAFQFASAFHLPLLMRQIIPHEWLLYERICMITRNVIFFPPFFSRRTICFHLKYNLMIVPSSFSHSFLGMRKTIFPENDGNWTLIEIWNYIRCKHLSQFRWNWKTKWEKEKRRDRRKKNGNLK